MGLGQKLTNAWYIFATSFSFIKKDKSLLVIPILLILSTIVFCIIFFISFFVSKTVAFAFFFNIVIFIFLMYLWSTFLGAAQSWMIHEVAQGKNATVLSGFKRAVKNLLDIIIFVFVMLLINIFISSLRKKGMVGSVAGGFIQLVTGIAGKLVLPAMIITERNFIQAVKQLRDALKTIPEIAAFEIGIRPLTSLITWISIGIAVLFGLGLGLKVGVIIFVIFLLFIMLFSILINQIYYTLLYLTLIEKKKVKGLKLLK